MRAFGYLVVIISAWYGWQVVLVSAFGGDSFALALLSFPIALLAITAFIALWTAILKESTHDNFYPKAAMLAVLVGLSSCALPAISPDGNPPRALYFPLEDFFDEQSKRPPMYPSIQFR